MFTGDTSGLNVEDKSHINGDIAFLCGLLKEEGNQSISMKIRSYIGNRCFFGRYIFSQKKTELEGNEKTSSPYKPCIHSENTNAW